MMYLLLGISLLTGYLAGEETIIDNNIRTSVPWNEETQTYDLLYNTPYNITCDYMNISTVDFEADLSWRMKNACSTRSAEPVVKNGDMQNNFEEKLGEIKVTPNSDIPKGTAETDGSMTFSQELSPMYFVNRTDCATVNYECEARSTEMEPGPLFIITKHKAFINITVVDPANITAITESQRLREGDDLLLYCNTSGIPVPDVTWSRVDGGTMPISVGGGTHITRKTPLNIKDVTDKVAGKYKCSATNRVTETPVEKTVDITIQYAPKVTVHLLIVNQMVGYHTEMSCTASSYPAITGVGWYYKPAQQTADSYSISITNFKVATNTTSVTERYSYINTSKGADSEHTILTIEPVEISDYNREFCCEFTNAAGKSHKCMALKESKYPVLVKGEQPRRAQITSSTSHILSSLILLISSYTLLQAH